MSGAADVQNASPRRLFFGAGRARDDFFSRTDRSPVSAWWWTVDRGSLAAIAALALIGLIILMAAGPVAADRKGISNEFHFIVRQVVFLGPALGLAFGASLLSPLGVRRVSLAVFLGGLALLGLTLIVGPEINGAQRWLPIGPIAVQPSEFVKPAFVVLAAWMFAEQRKVPRFPGAAIAFGLYVVFAGLLAAQPDYGQTLLVTAVWLTLFFIAGQPWIWIAGFLGLSSVAAFIAYAHVPHVASRIDRFLDPSSGDNYQPEVALKAIEAGGPLGRGPGEGVVKHHLPDAHTDYIFAVAGEEYGLIAGLVLIVLFGTIVMRAYARALGQTSPFAQLAACGLATMIGVQAFINMGVSLSLLPAKGMTLPFVSYGGSSLLATALTFGFLLALTRRRPHGRRRSDFV
ncbi:MAG: putative lipid II flippase FtsW [Pseudomonadota bacterium]